MSILADSQRPRMFKATRRVLVTEVTLVVVVVVTLSYGIFALYKLAAGSDPPFSFSLTPASTTSQQVSNTTHHLSVIHPSHNQGTHSDEFPKQPTPQVSHQDELRQQLAEYKNQILKELIAREERLLGSNRRESSNRLLSLLEPTRQFQIKQFHDNQTPEFNTNELKQWRGGYKLPSSLDYLFDRQFRNQPHQPRIEQHERLPLSSIDSHAAVSLSPDLPRPSSRLIQLNDAPSLMQLRPTIDPYNDNTDDNDDDEDRERRVAVTTTTLAPPEQPPLSGRSDDSPTRPQDSSTNSILQDSQDEQQSATTTTEAPPEGETTTIEPFSRDATEDSSDHRQGGPGWNEEETESAQKDTADDSNGRADEDGSLERVRKASNSIDEEVDRMTQPSSGMASRQDRPEVARGEFRSTVQFDDYLPQTSRRSSGQPPVNILKKVPKTNAMSILGPAEKPSRNRRAGQDSPSDLLVADDLNKSPIAISDSRSEKISHEGNLTASWSRFHRPANRYPDNEPTSANMRRMKRSTLADNNLRLLASQITSRKKPRRGAGRSDEETDEESEDQETSQEEPSGSKLVVSNGPTLQELLAHKQLLDVLQQSQLPAPVGESSQPKRHRRPPPSPNNSPKIKQEHPDNQKDYREPADTHYSVDQGLLLYPTSDEEHHHKSMSHSGGKVSKEKAKKKMTVAMKKGGHKNNKHKKEEKKYIKEKKFKGSKKGKKMKEGKGGKGGKKGIKKYRDKGFKKKGFKNTYVKNEFGQKKSYFDEFRDKDFKKKWKNFDDKYKYANMKKWQAKDVKGAKKMKEHGEKHKKYDKGKWKKKMSKHHESESAKKKKYEEF